jgi:hypothetical protein
MVCYKQGLRKLAGHKPEAALRFFNAAISVCPVKEASSLARILFCAGVALKKIGLHDSAVQSWVLSLRLVKTPPVLRAVKRFSNEYGMAKQGFAELDDWRAFYFLHLEKYLKMKTSHTLGTPAERDMIRDLIRDAWIQLKNSQDLTGKSFLRKIEIYKEISIVFPFFHVPCESFRGGFSPEISHAPFGNGDNGCFSGGKPAASGGAPYRAFLTHFWA